MKLKIKENAIDAIELQNTLANEFSNEYKVSSKFSSVINIAKNKIIGAKVIVQKGRLIIVGGFPNLISHIIFLLLVVFLGIILPLLAYFIFMHKKMKAVENDVANFIKRNYRAEIIT